MISKVDILESMLWMIEQLKWQKDQTGLGGDYSPELKKAILIAAQLCDENIVIVEKGVWA